MDDINIIKSFIADQFIKNKLIGCCLVATTILYEFLINNGFKCNIKLGFINSNNAHSCAHCWLIYEHDSSNNISSSNIDVIIDIGSEIIKKTYPIFNSCNIQLSNSPLYKRS